VATTLQARATERAERRAASAQARLSARVLTFVPFAVLAFLASTNQSVRASLVSASGLACVVAGGGLNLAGWWWMRRLIRGVS
ncbi:MAG: type II secretion system F family protein, partial [Ilumatobacteraceae bacterium]